MDFEAQNALTPVFRELVEVDERGEPTRRRAEWASVARDAAAEKLITALTVEGARLLVLDKDAEGNPTIEVAHEALLRQWPRLAAWIEGEQENLRLRRQIQQAAQEWDKRGRDKEYLLSGGRLSDARAWMERFSAGELEQELIMDSVRMQVLQADLEMTLNRQAAENARLAARAAERAEIAERQAREAAEFKATRARRAAVIAGVIGALAVIAMIVASLIATDTSQQVAAGATQVSAANAEAATLAFGATFSVLEINRAATLNTGWVSVPLFTQTPGIFDPALTQIAVLNAHDPSLPENQMTYKYGEYSVEMVFVPAGCFFMGSDRTNSNREPTHQVCLDAFWIDKYEVTNAQFEQLRGQDTYQPDWEGPKQPRTSVDWFEANDFCQMQRDARLPTEAEWEYAARGPDSRLYPWGNEFEIDYVVFSANSDNQPAEVGSKPNGVSWVGALDMSGNVWEWVSSAYRRYPYDHDDREDVNRTAFRVMRGGSFSDFILVNRADNRTPAEPDEWYANVGFRCARSQ